MRARRSRTASAVASVGLALLIAPFASLGAQQTAVPTPCTTQNAAFLDACRKAADLFNFMAPQLGVAVTGGNPVIGNATTLGGLGHFALDARVNLVQGQLPRTEGIQLSLMQSSSDFGSRRHVISVPGVDAAIGLLRGFNVGVTNVGGVDALLSAFYLPDIDRAPVHVRTPGSGLRLGYGARLGIIQETAFVPGISVSYLRRELPTVDIRIAPLLDSITLTGLEEKTSAVHVAASKGIAMFSVTAGAGRDRYASSGNASFDLGTRIGLNGPSPSTITGGVAGLEQTLTRTNVFVGASLHLSLLRVAAELGRVSGGRVADAFNRFGDRRADDPRTYGSLGLRLGF